MITNTELEFKGNLFPGKLASFRRDSNYIEFNSETNVLLRIYVLRDSVLRFRYAPDGFFRKDFSYAIDKDAVRGYNKLIIEELEDEVVLTTSKLICKVSKEDLRIGIYDFKLQALLEDELGFHWEESFEFGGEFVKMSKFSPEGESFFGLGDKPTGFNLKGKRVSNWNTDQYAYKKDVMELYKDVPFYIGLKNNVSYGVFFDNTFKTHFDFCQERRDVTTFWAEGGEMNYYFFYGPDFSDVVSSYTTLTGVPELPPKWTLGFQQCKWSYYPQEKVISIAQKFRDLSFPCDAIYLDIDYMDGFRCFTWNKEYFPDPKGMVDRLSGMGMKTVAIIDPGIKIDHNNDVFNEAVSKDYFCKRADGSYMKGKVWPGECYFPDFTNPEVRNWWAGLYKELIEDVGISGVWNDMNEPAVMDVPGKTFPNDVRHNYDGEFCSHRKAHNVYGMQMARATYEGVKRYAYPKRPFVITRANYSGGQRYTSSWTGDNIASWEHLWLANMQVQRMSISGMGFVGTDIGGFAEQPSGELFARWVQLGVFHPFCRVHSSGHHGDQEPWSFGDEVLEISKKFVSLRYQLLPYIYTMFYNYVNKGEPMIKPLVYFDQEDAQTHYRSDEFIFGNQILVCPIQEPNSIGRRMYLPRGGWYDFWSKEYREGGKEFWVNAPLDQMPLFIKEGAIIPKYPVQQYVGEKQIDVLELDVYYKEGKETSMLYDDSGDGYDHDKGRFSLKSIKLYGKNNKLSLQQHKTGDFDVEYKEVKLSFIGLPFRISSVLIDDESRKMQELQFNKSEQSLIVGHEFYSIILS